MAKGVLLDIDGTVIISNDAHAKSFQEAFKKYEYDIPFEEIRPLIGMGSDKLIPKVAPGLNIETGAGKEISQQKKQIFKEKYLHTLKPTPAIRDCILKIKEDNIKIIIASSAAEDELSDLLKQAGVDDLIKEAVSSSEVNESKPAPDIVKVGLEKLRLDTSETVMIGDAPYDIESAHASNVKIIIFKTGNFPDAAIDNADEVYKDPLELLNNYSNSLIKR